jgi:hypothetical protein
MGAGQGIVAGTSVGVDHAQGFVFLSHVAQSVHEHTVLEDIGKITGVVGVAITEHGTISGKAVMAADYSGSDSTRWDLSLQKMTQDLQTPFATWGRTVKVTSICRELRLALLYRNLSC